MIWTKYWEIEDNCCIPENMRKFADEAHARKYAKSMGHSDASIRYKEFLIIESDNDQHVMETQNIINKALAKLTQEEQRAFGFNLTPAEQKALVNN